MSHGEIPEGWASVRVNDILEGGGLFDGPFGSNLKTSDYTDSGVRVVRLENLANLRFVAEKVTYISHAKYKTLTKHTVVPGDILVGSFVDGAVRVCLLPEIPTKAIAKADCFTIRTRTDIADRRFIAFQLGSAAIRDAFVGDIHGATRPRITTRQLRECELGLAPLSEQRRIVRQIEALLEQVNRAKGRLDRVALILKKFRQAVLAAACTGELSEPVLPGEESSQTDLQAIINEVLLLKLDDPRVRRKRASDPQVPPALPESLPEHWERCRVGDVFDVAYGLSEPLRKTAPESTDDLPVISMANITPWGELNLSALKYFAVPASDVDRLTLRPGDLLLNWRNSPNWIGKTARFERTDRKYVNASFLLRLRPSRVGTYERFLRLYFNYLRVSGYFENASRAAVSQSNFNASEVAAIDAPFPPLEEQANIVRKVDNLFALADTIERSVQAAANRADRLPQAILSKAFSGELVPTEADIARAEGSTYETAQALLARLVGDGSSAVGEKTRRKSRRREKGAAV